MVDLTLESSIDAAVHVFGPNKCIFTRIFWICLFILSFYGLFYYISGSYTKWKLEPDIITKTRFREVKEFPKLTITICPQVFDLNAFNSTEILRKIKSNTQFSEQECFAVKSYDSFCRHLMNQIIGPNVHKSSIALKFDELILEKFYSFEQCPNDLKASESARSWTEAYSIFFEGYKGFAPYTNDKHQVVNVLTSYGPCTTIDMLRKNFFNKKVLNDAYGFVKEGEVEDNWTSDSEKFVPALNNRTKNHRLGKLLLRYSGSFEESCKNKTYKVIVHQPNELPTPFHPTVDITFGKDAEVFVKAKSERASEDLRALDPEVRNCYFEDEKELKYFKRYSKYNCMLECHANIKHCQPFEIPEKNFPFCASGWQEDYQENSRDARDCKCYRNCNYLDIEVSKKEEQGYIDEFNLNIRDLFYGEETEKIVAYTILNFVADTGGYLGLFLGCSLLSIVEIFFFITARVVSFMRKLLKHQSKNNDNNTPVLRTHDEEIQDLKSELHNIKNQFAIMQSKMEFLSEENCVIKNENNVIKREFERIIRYIKDEDQSEASHLCKESEVPSSLDVTLLKKIAKDEL